jgi:hypothetical protein
MYLMIYDTYVYIAQPKDEQIYMGLIYDQQKRVLSKIYLLLYIVQML